MPPDKAFNIKNLDEHAPHGDPGEGQQYDLRVLRSIRRIIRAVDIHSRKLYHGHRITTPQLICLHCLRREGPMTLSKLAGSISLGTSTTNGIVDRLEAKGLLTRTRSRQDRRKVDLAISPAGRDLISATPELLQDRLSVGLRRLPPHEQETLMMSLERVVELMGGSHLDSSPNLVSGGSLRGTDQATPKEQ